MLAFARGFKGSQCVGVENNPWLNLIARFRAASQRLGNASFKTGDLYKYPIGDKSVILACLVSSMLPDLERKLEAEAAPGTLVLCARFPLPTMIPVFQYPGGPIDGLWCYRIQSKVQSSSGLAKDRQ